MLNPPPSRGNEDPISADLCAELWDASESRHIIPPRQLSRADAIFIAALLLVCSLSVFIGIAAPLGNFAHDTFFLLDNAYRVLQGQVPSRDFSSAWGPIIFLIDAAGLG